MKTLKAARQERSRPSRSLESGGELAAAATVGRRGKKAGLYVCFAAVYCTDNAAMIAWRRYRPRLEYPDYMDVDASATLPLGRWLPETRAAP